MKIWKRNVIITGVLVLVCAGIYLNWLYAGQSPDLTETLNADKILGESTLVLNNTTNGDQALLEAANTSALAESFAQMRLSRQTTRDEAVQLLQETIAYAEGGDSGTSSAELEAIVANALTESQIESLVIAKGYEDCVAYISDGGISLAVSVPEEGLSEDDVAMLADIVLAQTDYHMDDIRVIPVE